jgi:hypothetical protein
MISQRYRRPTAGTVGGAGGEVVAALAPEFNEANSSLVACCLSFALFSSRSFSSALSTACPPALARVLADRAPPPVLTAVTPLSSSSLPLRTSPLRRPDQQPHKKFQRFAWSALAAQALRHTYIQSHDWTRTRSATGEHRLCGASVLDLSVFPPLLRNYRPLRHLGHRPLQSASAGISQQYCKYTAVVGLQASRRARVPSASSSALFSCSATCAARRRLMLAMQLVVPTLPVERVHYRRRPGPPEAFVRGGNRS